MADDLHDDPTGDDPYRDDSSRDRRPSDRLGDRLAADDDPRAAPRPPAFRDRMPPAETSRPPAFRGDDAFRDDRFEDARARARFGDHAALADVLDADDRPLADAGTRLIARIIDGLTVLLAFIPALVLGAVGSVLGGEDLAGPLAIAGLVAGAIALLVVQLRLLAAEGQTIGKRAMKIRIVDLEDGLHPGFARVFWMREVVNALIGGVVPLYGLVDALFVFRDDRRCIHDLLAKTVVVSEAQAPTRGRA